MPAEPTKIQVEDDPYEGFQKKTVTIGGTEYTFRELTVEENDECSDAAEKPDDDYEERHPSEGHGQRPGQDAAYSLPVHLACRQRRQLVQARRDRYRPKHLEGPDFERMEVARMFRQMPFSLKALPLSEYRKMRRYYWRVREDTEKAQRGHTDLPDDAVVIGED